MLSYLERRNNEMKRCKKCGNVYADSRTVCPECGEMLPAPMSDEEIANETKKTDRDAAEQKKAANAFHVGKTDRMTGILCAVFAVAAFLMAVMFFLNSNNRPGVICLGTAAAFALACGMLLKPMKMWEVNARRADGKGEKVYPTDAYLRVNKFFAYLVAAGAVLVLAAQIIQLFSGS